MKARFTIVGLATGGDEADIKMWLEESINQYNKMPKVVDSFNVQVDEVDDDEDFKGEYEVPLEEEF